jgi:hypothetical protein
MIVFASVCWVYTPCSHARRWRSESLSTRMTVFWMGSCLKEATSSTTFSLSFTFSHDFLSSKQSASARTTQHNAWHAAQCLAQFLSEQHEAVSSLITASVQNPRRSTVGSNGSGCARCAIASRICAHASSPSESSRSDRPYMVS